MDIVIIAIDLGKNSCSLAGMDASSRVVLWRRMRRGSLESFARVLGAHLRALLLERGIVAPQGRRKLESSRSSRTRMGSRR